jgi:hypothetical protein
MRKAPSESSIKLDMQGRMTELRPALVEFACLTQMLELIEHFKASQKTTYDDVVKWVKQTRDPTDSLKSVDLRVQFDKDATWAARMMKKLVADKVLEKWGRGLYRLPPDKTGEARIKLVS